MTALETMTDDCLNPETLAAFIDHNLQGAERARVIAHLADCKRCRDIVSMARELAAEEGEGKVVVRPSFTRRMLVPASIAAALAVLIGGAFLWRATTRQSDVEAMVLASKAWSQRAIEGRLSGGFAYRPAPETLRGAGDKNLDIERYKVWQIAGEIDGRAHKTASDLHGLGMALLLLGRYDEAIQNLEAAVRMEAPGSGSIAEAISATKDANLLNDLSAAYYARGKFKDWKPDYVAALDAAQNAWRIKKTPEIAWNRALAMSQIELHDAAEGAWRDFLRVSHEPEWTREANENIKRLAPSASNAEWEALKQQLSIGNRSAVQSAVARFPARAGRFVEETLLPTWSSDVRSERLELGRLIAAALSEQDPFLLDTLAAIDDACRTTAGCSRAAYAHRTFAEGQKYFNDHLFTSAGVSFSAAESGFVAMKSPFAVYARTRRIGCELAANDFSGALDHAAQLLREIEAGPYRSLVARAYWLVGLCELHAGHPEESIAQYEASRRLFTEAGDDASIAALHVVLADAYQFVGDPDAADEHRVLALQTMRDSGDWSRYCSITYEAGYGAMREGRLGAADLLLSETARVSVREKKLALASLATSWRAVIASKRGQAADARLLASVTRKFEKGIDDPHLRQRVFASLAVEAPAGDGSTQSPVPALTDAIGFFEKSGDHTFVPGLLQQRALLHENMGDFANAEADYRRAIDVGESMLNGNTSADVRAAYIAGMQAVYSRLIDLLLQSGRPFDAFDVAERARVAGTVDQGRRVEARNVPSRLPAGTRIVCYELRGNELVTWVFTRAGVRATRAPLPSKWSVLDSPSEQERARLYDLFIRGWIHAGQETRIVIVPAREVESVPFEALQDRATGRSIIDDYVVSIALNVSSFLHAGEPKSLHSVRVLVVADPAYRDLAHLPQSRREAEAIARLYERPAVLLGADATPDAVRRRLESADLFHFAGHAVFNDVVPRQSSLMLAGSQGHDERLYITDFPAGSFPKVVILSACSTARSRKGDRRPTTSIARAFLDEGVSVVIGTLHDVPDEASARFSKLVHEALVSGVPPVQAVRQAQLKMKLSREGATAWMVFRVMTGGPYGERRNLA